MVLGLTFQLDGQLDLQMSLGLHECYKWVQLYTGWNHQFEVDFPVQSH